MSRLFLAASVVILSSVGALAQTKTPGNIGIWSNTPTPNSLTDTGAATAPGEFTVDGNLVLNTGLRSYGTSVWVHGQTNELPAAFGTPVMVVGSDKTYELALVGYHINKSPFGTYDFPTGISGYGELQSAGGQVFGVFGMGTLATVTGTAIATEFTVRNQSGQVADTDLPPNTAIPNGLPVAIGENLTCGTLPTSKDCSIGLYVSNETGNYNDPVFAHGEYIKLFRQFGLVVAAQPSGTQISAELQNNGNGYNLELQTKGPFQPNNTVLSVNDNSGAPHASIRQNGDAYINGVHLKAMPVASLPTCVTGIDGAMYAVTDSPVFAWNTAITVGGGVNHVLAFCNGVEWLVR